MNIDKLVNNIIQIDVQQHHKQCIVDVEKELEGNPKLDRVQKYNSLVKLCDEVSIELRVYSDRLASYHRYLCVPYFRTMDLHKALLVLELKKQYLLAQRHASIYDPKNNTTNLTEGMCSAYVAIVMHDRERRQTEMKLLLSKDRDDNGEHKKKKKVQFPDALKLSSAELVELMDPSFTDAIMYHNITDLYEELYKRNMDAHSQQLQKIAASYLTL